MSEIVQLQLDPGWYRYKVTYTDEYKEHHQFVNQFFVQVTYDMFRRYAVMEPAFSKGRQTSDGIRWFCGQPQCKRSFTTKYGIVDHEKRHSNETIFKDVPWAPETGDDGRVYSKGIVILGGPPEGASAPPPRKAVLPPPIQQELEEARTQVTVDKAPEPSETPKKRRGRPKGSKKKMEMAHA